MSATRAISPAATDYAPRAPTQHEDVIMILGYTSWGAAAHRGRVQREDRLTLELIGSPRVRRLLVCNPYRSRPVKLLRRLTGERDEAFPESQTRRLHEPLRLRTRDPVNRGAIKRSCASYEASVRRAAESMGMKRPAVITTQPLIAGFCDLAWAGAVTYHATDDLTAYPPLERWAAAFEEAFVRLRARRRRTVAVSAGALRRVWPDESEGVVIPNGVDPAEWLQPGPAPDWFRALPRPRMLYVGALDQRIDAAAARAVATSWPSGTVALVGPGDRAANVAELAALPNVVVHPRVDRRDFPGLVAAADVGLIPHVRSRQTEAMSPLKLYEYLAAGIPVAAADLPGIAGVCPARTRLAGSPQGTVTAVAAALELGPWAEAARREFLFANSWASRFSDLLDVSLEAS